MTGAQALQMLTAELAREIEGDELARVRIVGQGGPTSCAAEYFRGRLDALRLVNVLVAAIGDHLEV